MNRTGRLLAAMATITAVLLTVPASAQQPAIRLGNEVLLDNYLHLVSGKRVGLVTNQTGTTGTGRSVVDVIAAHPDIDLRALYAPEHGLDGKARAGEYVKSYTHPQLNIPVYSLYGQTRYPTQDMLSGIDVLLFDIQDIGARTYTYMSTLNYCMVSAEKYKKKVVVLDRPNPLGGMRVQGPMMEERFVTFVGVDILPMAHGMTAGELARYFNRNIGADLVVVPMQGYQRNMIFADTGVTWTQTSPNIPDLVSCLGYMATGLGEGTGVFQADQFKWIGGQGLDSVQFAAAMNAHQLGGVRFTPEPRASAGGARLTITDYYQFDPARTGIYGLATAFSLGNFRVPKSTSSSIVMFDKIMGTDKFGTWLEQRQSPAQIERLYGPALRQFMIARDRYLLPDYDPVIMVKVNDRRVAFDTQPYIDASERVQVPVRAIASALGAQVSWNPAAREVTIARPDRQVRLTIGRQIIHVNGEARAIDTAPVIVSGRTMVPARFVAEHLGANVRWDGDWLMVHIN